MHYNLRTPSRSAIAFGTLFLFCMAGQNIPPGHPHFDCKQIPGALREIAIGGVGVWGIGTNAADNYGNYTIQHWNGSAWETVAGQAIKIAVEPGGSRG